MRKFCFLFICLLSVGCKKAEALSPYVVKNRNGEEEYISLTNKVSFELPQNIIYLDKCNPKNRYTRDDSIINVWSIATPLTEIQYMGKDIFENKFIDLLEDNNYIIDISKISKLIDENEGGTTIYERSEYGIESSYSKFKYKNIIMGESQWYLYTSDIYSKCPSISFYLYVVIKGYLVRIVVQYWNNYDDSICKAMPQFFKEKNGEYAWKSEEARNSFVSYILTAKTNDLPQKINEFVSIYNSIIRTIKISN